MLYILLIKDFVHNETTTKPKFLRPNPMLFSQIDQPRADGADVIDEPFVNYQERMTRAMKELSKKAHDMVSKT